MRASGPKIILLSSANWSILLPRIAKSLRAYHGEAPDLAVPAYGQYRAMLADSQSELRRSHADYYVFAERIEDFLLPFETLDRFALRSIRERFRDYLGAIKEARTKLGGVFLIHDLCPTRPYLSTIFELTKQTDGIASAMQEFNADLSALANELPDTIVVPLTFVCNEIGRQSADPGKYWLAGRIPFSLRFADAYGKMLSGIMLAREGRTVRALAIDLDNTLWGGVVGDDGMASLQSGTDFPDNRFLLVQEFAKALKRRGSILTLSSKNDEDLALDAVEHLPGMMLRKADFAAWSIFWGPKSKGIQEIADALGLSTSSFMLLDDNPIERDEVMHNSHGVFVPDLPVELADWPAFLFAEPSLTAIDSTAEDLTRTQSYEIRRQVRESADGISRDAFLESLGMSLIVIPRDETSARRVAQLFAKTNQFNTTGYRYGDAELQALQQHGDDVLAVRLTDKFGSDEVIGAVCVTYDPQLSKARIEGFVLSCRVLGRGVETGILSEISRRANERGMTELLATINNLPRNTPCRDVFKEHGFRLRADGEFCLDLSSEAVSWPKWFLKR